MSEREQDSGERLRQILHFSRVVKQLKAKIKTETRERIEDKLRRWQQLRTPELSAAVESVSEWDPAWSTLFEAEKQRIYDILGGERVSDIQHFGSTSIPGLASKKILDLFVAIRDEPVLAQEERLTSLDYQHYGVSPCDPEAHWFWNTAPDDHAFVVHVCDDSNPWIKTAVDFRDYMRVHPEACRRYEELKRNLKAETGRNLLEYSARKLILFYEVSEEAKAWRKK